MRACAALQRVVVASIGGLVSNRRLWSDAVLEGSSHGGSVPLVDLGGLQTVLLEGGAPGLARVGDRPPALQVQKQRFKSKTSYAKTFAQGINT